MSDELLNSVKVHLEHLGYKMDAQEKGGLWASHPNKIRFSMSSFRGGLLLMAPYEVKKDVAFDDREFRNLLNEGNRNAAIGRLVWDEAHKTLFAEAWYPNAYEIAAFGQFFDQWVDDIVGYLNKNREIASRYLA